MGTTDDLTPLLLTGNTGELPELGFHQGIVLSWNVQNGTNVIRVAGSDFVDLQMMNSTEALVLEAGHIVALLRFKNTYFILGRILTPNASDYFTGLLPTVSYPAFQTNADAAIQTSSADSNYYPKFISGFRVAHQRAYFRGLIQPSGGTPRGNFRVRWYSDYPGNGPNPPNGTTMATSALNPLGSAASYSDSYLWPESARGQLVYVSFEIRMTVGVAGEWMAVIPHYLYGAD